MGLLPTQGDENRLPSGDHSPWRRHGPLCHVSIPIADPKWKRRPPLVIPSGCDLIRFAAGCPLNPTNSTQTKRHPQLVIPSAAEGPAVSTDLSWKCFSVFRQSCHGPFGPPEGMKNATEVATELSSRSERSVVERSAVLLTDPGSVFRPSVPGFPASRSWQRPHMRLVVKRAARALSRPRNSTGNPWGEKERFRWFSYRLFSPYLSD